MNSQIFEYTDYKKAIRADIKSFSKQRGYQAKMARAAGCQPSFMSQVLNAHVQLTLDHAIGLSHFWRMNRASEDYFLFLVEHARAATPALKAYFQRNLDEVRKSQEDISRRVQKEEIVDKNFTSLYYSSWHLLALHVAINIPELNSDVRLAEHLRIPLDLASEGLAQLNQMNLIERHANKWVTTKRHLYLPRNSGFIGVHHTHWRLRAIENVQLKNLEDLHYSTVMALSTEDFRKLKSLLIEFVESSKSIVAPSKEEELICVNLDCFRV